MDFHQYGDLDIMAPGYGSSPAPLYASDPNARMDGTQRVYFMNIVFAIIVFVLAGGQIYTRDHMNDNCTCTGDSEHVDIWFAFSIIAILLGIIILIMSVIALVRGKSFSHQMSHVGNAMSRAAAVSRPAPQVPYSAPPPTAPAYGSSLF